MHNVNITEKGTERVLECRPRTKVREMEFTSSWDSISTVDFDTLRSALYYEYLPTLKVSDNNISNITKLVAEEHCVMHVTGIVCDSIITEDTVPTLCSIMKYLANLKHIKYNFLSINSASAYLLCDAIKSLKLVHSISLQFAFITNTEYSNIILSSLEDFTELHSLDLCNVSFEKLRSLFTNRESWVNIHTLNLRRSMELFKNIDYRRPLIDENIIFKEIGDIAQILCEVLVHCKCLCHLSLYRRGIGDAGALALAKGLDERKSLVELGIGFNNIRHHGQKVLNGVIYHNHELQHLDYNTLIYALLTLNFTSNRFDGDFRSSIWIGLNKCKQLVEL